MLTDAARYIEALDQIDRLMEALEQGIFDTGTSDQRAHDLRVRRKQLADVRALITGDSAALPHS